MKKMKLKPSETGRLIEAERNHLLQYACYRLGDVDEAEDAVQDVCLSLHSRLSEEGPVVRNPVAYLYRTLSNLCVTRLREAALHQERPLDTLSEPADTEEEDFEQEFRRISRLLSEIPDEQAEVIRLRFYGDKSFREIADILGLPLTTAKSRFTYGLEKIRRGMRAPFSQ